jgi:enoyl-CoA hydratase
MPDYECIKTSYRDRILTVTLNRPDSLNAIDSTMHSELARVFHDASRDPDSDIVVLTGAGRAFSAGGDVGYLQEMIEGGTRGFETCRVDAKRIVFSILELEKPLIAKVNGHAMGLGATIALLSDIIIAADSAKIGDPHVRIGFSAGDGGAVIWPQLVGFARAKEFLMTGDVLTSADAARIGLINHSVPDQELDARVDALCDRLQSGAKLAIRYTKITVNIALKQIAHSIMDASIAYESLTNVSRDHAEAVAAFRERRKPTLGSD